MSRESRTSLLLRWPEFGAMLAVLILLLMAVAFATHGRLMAQGREQAEQTLSGLAEIRKADVEHWLDDLKIKNTRPIDSPLQFGLMKAAEDARARLIAQERLDWQVSRSPEFVAGWLLDAKGRLVVSSGDQPVPELSAELLASAVAQRRTVLRDFYLDAQGQPRMAAVAPLEVSTPEQGAVVVGFQVVAIDPAYDLYPMLERGFPIEGQFETFIARKQGETVQYLSPLIGERLPLSYKLDNPHRQLLSLRGAEYDGQIVEGQDYRGMAVMGVVHHLPELDWVLVTKMDEDAVRADAEKEFHGLLLRLAVLAVVLVLLLWVAMHYLRARSDLVQLSGDLERVRRDRQFDFFVRFANDIVLLMDEAGNILQSNDAASKAYGYAPEELLGMNIAQLRAPESLPTLERQLALATGAAGLTFRTTHRRKDGSCFPVEVSSGTFDHDGRRYRQSFIRDISAREAAEGQLRRALDEQIELNRKLEEAQNQLLQSEKMASIGQLAAGVAHEINNPVGFVSSNMGTLRQYLEDLLAVVDHVQRHHGDDAQLQALLAARDMDFIREDAPALLKESMEGIARVRKIVQDLKDFSRVGETDWQWADLHQGLDSTINIVWNEIKYKSRLEKDYGELPEIWCLPSQLNQVFLNLLVNAAHAITQQGVITVRTGRGEADQVWVEIADTGCGIAAEHLGRLFDPFFTTKPVGQGTGLGLSLAFSIVRKHGGHIEVRSTPGQGSAFRVLLPRVPPAASPAPDVPDARSASCKEPA